jgi:hypothetical protein
MSDPINITISGDALDYVRKISNPAVVLPALARAMDYQNQLTIAHLQRDYLSYPKGGPSVPDGLRVQSNRLRSSARATKTIFSDAALESSIGSNVFYAIIHEEGADHPSRATKSQNKSYAKKHPTTKAWSTPARGLFRRSITDRLGDYNQAFSATILNLK